MRTEEESKEVNGSPHDGYHEWFVSKSDNIGHNNWWFGYFYCTV